MKHPRSYYRCIMEVYAGYRDAHDSIDIFIVSWLKRKASPDVIEDAKKFYLYGCPLEVCAIGSTNTLVRSHLKTFRRLVWEAEDINLMVMLSLKEAAI